MRLKCVCGNPLKYVKDDSGCGDLRCLSCGKTSGYCANTHDAIMAFKRIYDHNPVPVEEVKGMNENVKLLVFLKDGGQEYTVIPKQMVGELAALIAEKGSEVIQLASGKAWEVVGFMVYSKQIGERVIFTGQGGTGDE